MVSLRAAFLIRRYTSHYYFTSGRLVNIIKHYYYKIHYFLIKKYFKMRHIRVRVWIG